MQEEKVTIQLTKHSRKMDSVGRLMFPSSMRKELCLKAGQEYNYYLISTESGENFIAIKCPDVTAERVKDAIQFLKENGYTIEEQEGG